MALASPSLPNATTTCSFSAKLSPPNAVTSAAKSSASAGSAAATISTNANKPTEA